MYPDLPEIDRTFPDGLRRIDVQCDRARIAVLCNLRNRLNRTRLVVGPDHRHEFRLVVDLGDQLARRHTSVFIRSNAIDPHAARLQDR